MFKHRGVSLSNQQLIICYALRVITTIVCTVNGCLANLNCHHSSVFHSILSLPQLSLSFPLSIFIWQCNKQSLEMSNIPCCKFLAWLTIQSIFGESIISQQFLCSKVDCTNHIWKNSNLCCKSFMICLMAQSIWVSASHCNNEL